MFYCEKIYENEKKWKSFDFSGPIKFWDAFFLVSLSYQKTREDNFSYLFFFNEVSLKIDFRKNRSFLIFKNTSWIGRVSF